MVRQVKTNTIQAENSGIASGGVLAARFATVDTSSKEKKKILNHQLNFLSYYGYNEI